MGEQVTRAQALIEGMGCHDQGLRAVIVTILRIHTRP